MGKLTKIEETWLVLDPRLMLSKTVFIFSNFNVLTDLCDFESGSNNQICSFDTAWKIFGRDSN